LIDPLEGASSRHNISHFAYSKSRHPALNQGRDFAYDLSIPKWQVSFMATSTTAPLVSSQSERLKIFLHALLFVAGLLSFLSPCVLPLVPAYLGYLSGHTLHNKLTH